MHVVILNHVESGAERGERGGGVTFHHVESGRRGGRGEERASVELADVWQLKAE